MAPQHSARFSVSFFFFFFFFSLSLYLFSPPSVLLQSNKSTDNCSFSYFRALFASLAPGLALFKAAQRALLMNFMAFLSCSSSLCKSGKYCQDQPSIVDLGKLCVKKWWLIGMQSRGWCLSIQLFSVRMRSDSTAESWKSMIDQAVLRNILFGWRHTFHWRQSTSMLMWTGLPLQSRLPLRHISISFYIRCCPPDTPHTLTILGIPKRIVEKISVLSDTSGDHFPHPSHVLHRVQHPSRCPGERWSCFFFHMCNCLREWEQSWWSAFAQSNALLELLCKNPSKSSLDYLHSTQQPDSLLS